MRLTQNVRLQDCIALPELYLYKRYMRAGAVRGRRGARGESLVRSPEIVLYPLTKSDPAESGTFSYVWHIHLGVASYL